MLTLVSNDNKNIEVGMCASWTNTFRFYESLLPVQQQRLTNLLLARDVAERSLLIHNLLDDLGTPEAPPSEPIPIPNVSHTPSDHPRPKVMFELTGLLTSGERERFDQGPRVVPTPPQ